MVSATMSKIILAASMITTLVGGFVGITKAMVSKHSTVPSTGYYHNPAQYGVLDNASLEEFVQTVYTGNSRQVAGIYVPGVLALPVGQQPKNDSGYVTRTAEQTTQFAMASQYGTVGILAHNDLAGAQFTGIELDQYAIVVYGDGKLEYYKIREIQKYQALSPTSTFSDFVNLDGSNEMLSASNLFSRIYGPGNRLVFQTCIEAEGNPSWGRMFIVAEPANNQVLSMVRQASLLMQFSSFGMAAAAP
jgi:hypothetical protein